jgi:hypothetical protein
METAEAVVRPAAFHACATGPANVGIAQLTTRSWFGDVAVVVFLLAQATDGILTYVGVSTFGRGIEGNPMIVWLMSTLGNGAGLATAKVAAACFGIALHLSAVHQAVAALAGFYVVVAIVPWVALLFIWA